MQKHQHIWPPDREIILYEHVSTFSQCKLQGQVKKWDLSPIMHMNELLTKQMPVRMYQKNILYSRGYI
jgi:hypothetical protein